MEHCYEKIKGYSASIPDFYKVIVEQAKDNSHFVEVGSYIGRSAAIMIVEIINSGKEIKFDCIDTWQGSPEHKRKVEKAGGDLYPHFKSNLETYGLFEYLTPHKMTSLEGSELFQSNSLDFVFIDANHSYESVKEDIEIWKPLIKQGGILAGHDYGTRGDSIYVKRAVDELILNPVILGRCWYKTITHS